MVYQSQSNGYVAYKVQSGLGSQASGSGGTILRQAGGAGANATKAATESNEVRRDGMRTRGRHGTQKTTGAWSAETSLGSHEAIIEAIMRDTWSAADLAITEAMKEQKGNAMISVDSIREQAHTLLDVLKVYHGSETEVYLEGKILVTHTRSTYRDLDE